MICLMMEFIVRIKNLSPSFDGRGGWVKKTRTQKTRLAKRLRNNPTDAEMLLWQRIKSRQLEGVKFRRQEPIEGYIIDFISFEKRFVVELDGGQHAVNRDAGQVRDRCLRIHGFKVLRFWNNEVFQNLEGVLEVIRDHCLGDFKE